MGLLDKVKNLFTEEVEVEVEEQEVKPKKKPKKEKRKKEEPIQKEVIKVEIPSPEETRVKRSEINTYEEPVEKKEDDYKFPFFDDDDFDVVKPEEKTKREEKVYKTEVYNPPKEEKKVFKPSPIISPVYGFLDKDYQKEEIINKKNEYSSRRATVDELREKAYGSLESDIETTLFGSNRVTFDERENTKELKKVDEELEKIENEVKEKIKKPRHQRQSEDDLTDLLEAEMAKPEVVEKKKKPKKISDKELFSLIDSMYEGEIK